MQTEAAGERGGNGGLRRGKSRRRGVVAFVLGMPGLRGQEELDIHRGEDFSTRAHPLIHADRSSGPVFVTAHTLDHL